MTDSLWEEGRLAWMLRRHGQRRIHRFIQECQSQDTVEPIQVNAHRRLGKSFLPILLGMERCLKQPGQRVIFGAPTYDQVRDISVPLLDQILTTCPPHLRPTRSGYEWTFRNPRWNDPRAYSVFRIAGVDWKGGDRLRGSWADAIFLDEVGQVKDLRYVVEDVLIPQFVGRDNPVLAMFTTPPRTMDHDWVSYFIPRAIEAKRYICIPGSLNEDFTDRDKQLVLRAIGGDESSASYRREVECELITDPEDLITPEFSRLKGQIVVESYPRPQWFHPYTVMDTGFDPDHTAALFGFVDWVNHFLVIEDEVFRRRMTLADINKAVRSTEAKLWGNKPFHPIRRIADLDPRGIADLSRMFKLHFRPAEKFNHESALARLRTNLQSLKIRILGKCTNLIYQLEHGVWNAKRTDYERSDQMGHWDAGQALVYLNRMAQWRENPCPDKTYDLDSQFVICQPTSSSATLLKALGRK